MYPQGFSFNRKIKTPNRKMMKCPNTTNFSLYKLHCNYPPGLIIPLLPLKLQPLPIRLTTVRPSALLLLLLVAAETRA